MPSGYATRRRWRETLGDDVVLRMNAARSPRAAGGASDVGEPARRMCAKPGRTGCGRRKNSKRAAKVTETGRPRDSFRGARRGYQHWDWKRNVLITNTRVPYKVYNSVPLVLYLKPFRTTGCTN